MSKLSFAAAAAALVLAASPVLAQQPGTGTGPVGQSCQDEIAKFCADKSHGDRGVRNCLEANKAKVSEACRNALDTTGPGRGMGRGMGANRAN